MLNIRNSLFFLICCVPLALAGQQYLTFNHDGLTRDYILYLPDHLPQNSPLVFMLHGYSGSASGIMNYSGMNDLADENKFAVCYPEGTEDNWGNHFWNVGYDFHWNETVDDLDFITALASYLQTNCNLSQQFTFCSGMSNGGDMCYLLACKASATFLSVAPIAGCMMKWIYDSCEPGNVMPIFAINGTDDDVTLWNGDINNLDGWGPYMGVMDAINFWSELNNTSEKIIEELPDINPDDGSTITAEKYNKGTDGNKVWLYKVNGGGHDWPGVWGNMDIDSGQEIWSFFKMVIDNTIAGTGPDEDFENPLTIFPNPAFSSSNIKLSGYESDNFSIYDVNGKLWLSGSLDFSITTIDISTLSHGLYFIRAGEGVVRFVR